MELVLPSDSPRPFFPVASCAARRRKGPNENHRIHRRRYRFRSVCYSPLVQRRATEGAGALGEDCLRGVARVPQPPGRTSSAGYPAKPGA